jgi:rhodanese-related sulfurtransferase
MGNTEYFKPVPSMSAEEVREFIKKRSSDEYNLIDVRQPQEYERGHISGSRLIPLGDIAGHVHELDPEKPTITY